MPDPDWWQSLWPDPKQVLAAVGIRADMEVVDLCCGDGLHGTPCAYVPSRRRDRPRPGHAEGHTEQGCGSRATNCELIEGDAYAVAELVGRPVDYVLIANTFHGVPDKPRLARGVAAILKPGGRFAVITWHRRPREQTTVLGQPRGPRTNMRMEAADVAATVGPSGLTLIDVIELPPYHYGAIFGPPSLGGTVGNAS